MFFEIDEDFEVPPEALEQFWGFYDCYLEKLEDGKVRLNEEGMNLYLSAFMRIGANINEIDTPEKFIYCFISEEFKAALREEIEKPLPPIEWSNEPVPDDPVAAASHYLIKALDLWMKGLGTRAQLEAAYANSDKARRRASWAVVGGNGSKL